MRKNKLTESCKYLYIAVILFFSFLPLYLMVNISLKTNKQFAANPWLPEGPFHFENYVIAWSQIGDKIMNTTFVAVTTVVLTLGLSIVGAFFFARYKMPGSKILFGIFMLLMLYPGISNMVPTFKIICSLNLYNTYWSLILLGVAGGQVFNIYILRNFIEEIPQDLFDAVEIDGGNVWTNIWNVVIPLSMPIIGTLAILAILGQWNNFVGPLIFIRDNSKQMLTVGLLHLEGEYTKKWGELMAGYTIASLPLVVMFFFSMKLFIKGLTSGAVKG